MEVVYEPLGTQPDQHHRQLIMHVKPAMVVANGVSPAGTQEATSRAQIRLGSLRSASFCTEITPVKSSSFCFRVRSSSSVPRSLPM
ncbi:hypothetical protein T440DRAFT_467306 [Plenodomus tracheiphilus IPT5]|uniref:Uncharacterized protein n=1 Tax=Plenodomus tracheiphilus IPT5 TaxID=1408161 RepID=A0A6A7B9J0_9PLEO|nr:hypothetical protein T440DRAFT_467306 [Plenodomus tracheiphilus IPT5]